MATKGFDLGQLSLKVSTAGVLDVIGGGTGVTTSTGTGSTVLSASPTLSGVVSIAAGTALLPALIPTSDPNTGLWFPAADTVAISTSGVEAVRINAAGDVGIGTASPSTKLTVNANTVLPATAPPTGTNLWVTGVDATASRITIDAFGSTPSLSLRQSAGTAASPTASQLNTQIGNLTGFGYGATAYSTTARASLNFYAAESWTDTAQGTYQTFGTTAIGAATNLERMRIDSSGNVGIGGTPFAYGAGYVDLWIQASTTPVLDLAIGSTRTGTFFASSTAVNFGTVAAVPLIINTANTERMRIDASGNVGIGTASPNRRLDVNGYARIGGIASSLGQVADGLDVVCGSGTNAFQVWDDNNLTTPRFIVQRTGTVLVATTSATPNPGIAFAPAGNITVGNSAAATGFEFHTFRRSATQIGSITQNGTTAVAYNTSSDYRLKENITPMTGALDTVSQLKPVTYSWKSDGSDGQGFIAHELQAVVPDCVTGEKDAVDAEGNPVHQGIDTSFLVATLTAAIQEQQALITQLQADVAALKAMSA